MVNRISPYRHATHAIHTTFQFITSSTEPPSQGLEMETSTEPVDQAAAPQETSEAEEVSSNNGDSKTNSELDDVSIRFSLLELN